MKKVNYLIFTGLLLCILFMLIGCTAPSIDLTPEEEINALIDKFGAGFEEEDVNKVLSCCHDPILLCHYNWEVCYSHPLSSYQVNLENMFAVIDFSIDEFTNRNINFTSESEAIVLAIEHVEGINDSVPFVENDQVSLTLVKEGGSWKISKYETLQAE